MMVIQFKPRKRGCDARLDAPRVRITYYDPGYEGKRHVVNVNAYCADEFASDLLKQGSGLVVLVNTWSEEPRTAT